MGSFNYIQESNYINTNMVQNNTRKKHCQAEKDFQNLSLFPHNDKINLGINDEDKNEIMVVKDLTSEFINLCIDMFSDGQPYGMTDGIDIFEIVMRHVNKGSIKEKCGNA